MVTNVRVRVAPVVPHDDEEIADEQMMVNSQSDDIVKLGTEGGTLDNAVVISGRSNAEEFLESKLFESICSISIGVYHRYHNVYMISCHRVLSFTRVSLL